MATDYRIVHGGRSVLEFSETVDCFAHGQAGPWLAIRARSNYERVVAAHIRNRGFEEFLPTYRSESKWSDRRKIVDRCLFPGYVFARFDPKERLKILSVPGVVSIVGFGQEGPCPIPEDEIRNVRALVESGLLVKPCPFLQVGEFVLVERGPLAGVEGLVREMKGTLRVVVSITMLQRSVEAEIERSWVRPLKESQLRTRRTHGEWVSTGVA
jgi:transcription antitermination factor NusG